MPHPPTANVPEPEPVDRRDGSSDQESNSDQGSSDVSPRPGHEGYRSVLDEAEFDGSSEAYASDFADWVEGRRLSMADRWGTLVAQRTGRTETPVDPLLARFYNLWLQLLPGCLGPYRSQFVPLFRNLAELYGSVGAARGLAAGEIIEEVQILRDVLIRRLFAEPPPFRRAPVLLREILRLNRMVDRSVTYASVGHTDAMFFSLFQGSGVPAVLTRDVREEIGEQLDDIEQEARQLLSILSRQ